MVFALACHNTMAEDQIEVAKHAQLEVVAKADGVRLRKGTWLFADDYHTQRIDWREGQSKESTYNGQFAILPFASPSVVFMFVTTGDTDVEFQLMGPWIEDTSGEPKRLKVKAESLRFCGAKIVEGEFKPKTIWARDPIQLKLAAKKGVPVFIEIRARSVVPKTSTREPTCAHKLAKKLKRGVNISNWLEVPSGEDWGDNSCDARDMIRIKREGFDHIRLPVGWHNSIGPQPAYAIDRSYFRKVDRVIQQATQAGLSVIINEHGFDRYTENPTLHRAKLLAIWKQLSRHYADQPDSVFFEVLNEPAENATTQVMNELYRDVLPIIRETNPNRGVLVGPSNYNSAFELKELELPKDDQALIVAVHNYDPFPFTHQKASWTSPGVRFVSGIRFPGPPHARIRTPTGAEEWTRTWIESYNAIQHPEYNACGPLSIRRGLDIAAGYGEFYNRPIHLGEFGVYTEAEAVSRANYMLRVRVEAEKRNLGWAVWDWKADFAYWNRDRNEPHPLLRRALFGNHRD